MCLVYLASRQQIGYKNTETELFGLEIKRGKYARLKKSPSVPHSHGKWDALA